MRLKADQNFIGLYPTMLNEFLSRKADQYAFLNLEQDLSLECLRKSKLSYHPVGMVKKFTPLEKLKKVSLTGFTLRLAKGIFSV